MKMEEIRDMGSEELMRKQKALQEDFFRLRIRHSAKQLENPSALKRTRKDIARILTVLRQREAE